MCSFILRVNHFTSALSIKQAVHSAPEILYFTIKFNLSLNQPIHRLCTGINYIPNEKGEKSGLQRLSISPLNYHVVMLHCQLSEFQGDLNLMFDLDV